MLDSVGFRSLSSIRQIVVEEHGEEGIHLMEAKKRWGTPMTHILNLGLTA